jgi:hypothetical protein
VLLGNKPIRTTEVYAHLSERHLHYVVGQLTGPKMDTHLGTPVVFPGLTMAQVAIAEDISQTYFLFY